MPVRSRTSILKEARETLEKRDKALAKVIKQVGDCKLIVQEMQSPFEALARAIVYQQLTGKAAGTIFARVKALHGDKDVLEIEDILKSTEEDLRAAGCSRAKALALKDLAVKTVEGVVPTLEDMHEMSDDELVERLSSIRGVGRWTVEMMLMFRLGRLDVMPSTDLGVRKGLAIVDKMDELPTPKEVMARGERWKPFRSVASWYLWRANEL